MSTPTLDEIQRAAQRFRAYNSVMALREILLDVTGEPLTTVAAVAPEDRAAVIARLEGRETTTAKAAGSSSLLTDDGTAVDPAKVYAKWNRTGARAGR